MKKIVLLAVFFISIFSVQGTTSRAEEIVYPFDSITIVSAFTFDILIEELPAEESVLFGHVTAGETIAVYVGNLEFVFEGEPVQGSGSIIILTNENDEDFVAWLLNSGGSGDGGAYDAQFGSWITIDAEVGVVKDLSDGMTEVGYSKSATDEFTFKDNLNVQYPMVVGSYVLEESLNITISAYVEEE